MVVKTMNKLIILAAILLTTSNVFANNRDWSKVKCPKNHNIIAKELIEYWLMGPTLTKRSNCLDRANFKYIESSHNPAWDEDNITADIILKKKYKIKISSIEEIDDIGEYEVRFSIKTKNETYFEELSYLHFPLSSDDELRRTSCAAISLPPRNTFILKRCL